jgi:REP element-mobilizing transposase RayT
MTTYRRNFIPGGSFFFTVNLADRRLSLLTMHVESLRAAFRDIRQRHPFTIDAIVVLPDHLHTVWTLPDGDADFATRWRLIKSTFSRSVPMGERVSASRAAGASVTSGSAAIGNIPSATRTISPSMWTTSTSIPSSTAWFLAFAIGSIPRSTGWSSWESIRRIGLATLPMAAEILASGSERKVMGIAALNPSYGS